MQRMLPAEKMRLLSHRMGLIPDSALTVAEKVVFSAAVSPMPGRKLKTQKMMKTKLWAKDKADVRPRSFAAKMHAGVIPGAGPAQGCMEPPYLPGRRL